MTGLDAQQSTTTSYEHVLWIGFWGNLGLAILKTSVGILGYSRLLFADGLHSSANAIISIVFLIGVIAGEKPKDIKHPYGHHKAQYVISLTTGLIVLIAACFLFMLGIRGMKWIDMIEPDIIAISVVIVSILGNELLFRYGTYASHKFHSALLRSNAWNNRMNTFSSVVILISLLGTMVGFWRLEQLATMIVSVVIIWTCMRIFQKAFEGLMSRALPSEMSDKIKRIAESVKGVKAISTVKTQIAGEKIHLDLMVVMDGTITTANAKIIANNIRKKLFQDLKKVGQVRVGFESV